MSHTQPARTTRWMRAAGLLVVIAAMSHTQPARTNRWMRAAGLLVVIAAIAAALGGKLPASPPSTAASHMDVPRSERRGAPGEGGPRHRGRLGEADGAVPDGTTVFDDEVPGVAKLDPALRSALRQAATDAAGSGVEFIVDSGWRSAEYQAQLLREAISKYGSQTSAARWVATPNTSAHVKGDAVDIGPSDAAAWLSEHGGRYELCRIYANEPWHFELRPDARDRGCPRVYADPTQDPRMQP